MKIPPIPPNCEFFLEVDGRWVFSAVGGFAADSKLWARGDWPWPLDDIQAFQVPIIAAVARCAFLDIGDIDNAEKWKK